MGICTLQKSKARNLMHRTSKTRNLVGSDRNLVSQKRKLVSSKRNLVSSKQNLALIFCADGTS